MESKSKKFKINSEIISITSILICLAFITSTIKIFKLPMGGSITLLSMFFVSYIGYITNPIIGFIGAFIYGILQFVVDPYIFSIPQFLVDYIFAFTVLGVSSFFRFKKHGLVLGYLASAFGRLVFATLSGFLFFGSYAADYNMAPFWYSLAYNSIYIGAEAIITVIIISIPPINKLLKKYRTLFN